MKYVYPAVFEIEEDGYSVFFPDLEGCYTCGDNLSEALDMAKDALATMLCYFEKENKTIPLPSPRETIVCDENSFVNYISCDTVAYKKMYNNKAVRKTLTIPEWLNELALQKDINFSKVLQEALMERLVQ